jgi:hypothetical protein
MVTVKTIKDHEETESLLMISRWYAFQIGRKRMMVLLPQRYWRIIEKREPFWSSLDGEHFKPVGWA